MWIQRGDEAVFEGLTPVDQNKEVLESRLTLELRWENWVLGGRFDHLAPFFYGDEFTGIRKRFLEYEDGTNHLRVGSFGALLGRGLGLNLYEDPAVNVDRELEGVLLERRTDRYTLSLLGGLGNFLQFDFPEGYRRDRVGAVHGTYRALDWLELGQGYVETRDGVPGESQHINRKILTTVRADFDQGSVYGEAVRNWLRISGGPRGGPSGRGIYLEVDRWFDDFTLTAAYKNYSFGEESFTSTFSGVGVPWSEPPSLRPISDLATLNRKQFLVNKNNELGFSLEGAFETDSGSSFSVFYLQTGDRSYFDLAGGGDEIELTWPRWVGFEGISGSLTNTIEELTLRADLPVRDGWSTHVAADLTIDGHFGAQKMQQTLGLTNEIEFGDVHGLIVALEYQRTDDRRFEELFLGDFPDGVPPLFHDGIGTLTYSRSPWLAAFISYERTNEAKHWEAVGYKGALEPLEDSYWIAGVDLDITQLTRLGLQFGRERGGVVCRGGTCKFIQPFKGWRMELLQRF